ncbi:MAG: response regulator [Verrucomicrobiota bacterium]
MKPIQILIVEDELILAMDLEARLVDMGYAVVGMARTGEDAIADAVQHKVDVILMDIHLSGEMDGIAASMEIRRHLDIPIVFLSAYTDEETSMRAQAVAPCGFLSKLSDDMEVRAAIESALAKRIV